MAVKYSFNGSSNGLNPPLVLVKGVTYTFNVNTPGHPFWIKASPVAGTGGVYSNGVTNNGASSGTITFTVPQNAPNILYYVSQNDVKLVNEIFVVNSTISIIGDPYIQGNARVSGSVNITGSSNISGSQIISGSSRITGSQSITGSSNISGSEYITGSLFVTGSQFLTGSLRITGSQHLSGSLNISGSATISGSLIVTGSQVITGSLNISGSTFLTGSARITGSQSITGSLDISGSSRVSGSSFVSGTLFVSGSTHLSGSVNILGSGSVSGSWTVTGDITARQIIISSSIIYVTESYADGSHVFGNTQDDTHQFTGSVFISHSLTSLAFTGSSYTGSFTGSFNGTASWAISASRAVSSSRADNATTASYALSALSSSYALTASYVQNAISASYALSALSSSHAISASHLIGQSPTASYALTASYVQNAISASYISERVKTLNALTYAVPSFLKLTGDGTVSQDINDYLTVNSAASTYVTATFLTSNYSTTSTIASTYQTILSNPITGTGTRTANYVSKFGSSSTIQNSIIYDNGSIVGINNTGTITGGGTLQVGGDVNITGVFKINGNTVSTSQWANSGADIYFNTGKVYIGNATTNRTGESYKFTVSPGTNANLGVGTTDPGISLISHSDAFSFGSPSFQAMSFVASSYVWYGGFASPYMTFSDSTYKISVTGNIGASAYYETSDIRLKNVIEKNPNIDLSSLTVIKYTRKNDESNQIHYGYSAQDVQILCKDLVNDSDDYLTLNYTNVHTLKIAQLEKEIKELKQLIKNK